MTRWIVGLSMRLGLLIMILAAVLVIFGVQQISSAPVDVYPEFNPPMVEVQTEALGLSAAEMEALITVPLEADLLNGVAWLDQIYSKTTAGVSSIILVFEEGTDFVRARQMVQEKMHETHALPNVSRPPAMLQPLSTTSRVMMIGISSEDLPLIDLGVLARWNIRPRLEGVPGVANVSIWGARDRQLQVQVDPERLNEAGVTLDQVISTTGEALWASPLSYLESSAPGVTGWIDTPNQRLTVQHFLPISTAEDLAKVAVTDTEGMVLGDVATVVEDHQPLIGDAILNDGPGLLIVIEKFPGVNTLEVTQGVEEALEALKPGLAGVNIDSTIFRPANYIETATSNLGTTAIIGAVLVILVLGVLLFEWRTALISIIVIPVALVFAAFVLASRGATFNIMVLLGMVMALGVIIDEAIVHVEHVARRLRENRAHGDGMSAEAVITEAFAEIRGPLGYALLIVLIIAVPILATQGLANAFFQPLVVSYIIAVLSALAVALLLTPALSLTLLANAPLERRMSPIGQALQAICSAILSPLVRAPVVAIGIAVVVGVIGIAVLPGMSLSPIPSLQQPDLLIEWETAPGTSRTEMDRVAAQVIAELRAVPGVNNVGAHVGRAITGDAIVGLNSGELWVNLDPAADSNATQAAIQEIVSGYPGVFRQVQAYRPDRIEEALVGASQDLIVRVYGHDQEALPGKAAEVQQAIAGINGVESAVMNIGPDQPEVQIEVDLLAAERYQVKPGDVRRAATTLLAGLQVGNLYEQQKIFDVVVWGVPEIRDSVGDVENLLIDTPSGELVRLGELADIKIAPAPLIIQRDAVSRYIDVAVHISGRDIGGVAADIERALDGVEFPLEFRAEVLGLATGQQASMQRILIFSVAVLIGSLLIMQAAFGSWKLALVGILTLPMALAGGAIAAMLSGGVLTLGSLFGFLAVLAVAVRNTIVMVNHFQRLEYESGEAFGPELVMRGARDRFVPILMTALATVAALIPVLLNGGSAGNEILLPMAVVIIGGLITSTLLGLFVLPSLYLRFGSRAMPAMSSPQLTDQPSLEMA